MIVMLKLESNMADMTLYIAYRVCQIEILKLLNQMKTLNGPFEAKTVQDLSTTLASRLNIGTVCKMIVIDWDIHSVFRWGIFFPSQMFFSRNIVFFF